MQFHNFLNKASSLISNHCTYTRVNYSGRSSRITESTLYKAQFHFVLPIIVSDEGVTGVSSETFALSTSISEVPLVEELFSSVERSPIFKSPE